MKKLLIALLLILLLTGCSEFPNGETEFGEPVAVVTQAENEENYYTKEEVDLLLRTQIQELEAQIDEMQEWCEDLWIDVPDDILGPDGYYDEYDCIDMMEWYGNNWEELYDLMDYMKDEDRFATDLDEWFEDVLLYIQELEARIEELETESQE